MKRERNLRSGEGKQQSHIQEEQESKRKWKNWHKRLASGTKAQTCQKKRKLPKFLAYPQIPITSNLKDLIISSSVSILYVIKMAAKKSPVSLPTHALTRSILTASFSPPNFYFLLFVNVVCTRYLFYIKIFKEKSILHSIVIYESFVFLLNF